MNSITAKVFKAGNSQALRLPRSLGITAKAFEVTLVPDGFLLIDQAVIEKRHRALDRLMKLPPMHEEWPRPQ